MLERKERFFCWSAKGSWAVWSSCGVPAVILFNMSCDTGAGISNSKNYDVNGVCFDHLHSDDQDIRNKSIYNRDILFVIVTIHIITSSASASRGSLLLSVLTWGGGKWYRVANIPWLTFIIIHFPNKEFKIVISGEFRTLAGGRWCPGLLVRFPNPLSSGRHSWQLGNLTKVYLQWQRKSWNFKKCSIYLQHLKNYDVWGLTGYLLTIPKLKESWLKKLNVSQQRNNLI